MPLFVIPYPIIDPVLVNIGPFAIRWYALSYIVGILLGWVYARMLIANERNWGGRAPLTVTDFDDFILWVTLGIILGGRTGYVLFYDLPRFMESPAEILKVWNGGMSFHGGFLGCVFAVGLFSWKRGISWLSLGDITCAVAPIGLFLGRLANFINGELWGRTTDVPWAMVFPNAEPAGVARHPSQLYEAGLEGLTLFVLLTIAIRMGALRRPGLAIGLFAVFYALFRSLSEMFREPDKQLGFIFHTNSLTMGMLLSVPLLLIGIAFIVAARQRPPLKNPDA